MSDSSYIRKQCCLHCESGTVNLLYPKCIDWRSYWLTLMFFSSLLIPQNLIREFEGIHIIAGFLSDPAPEVRVQTLNALNNLCMNIQNQEQIKVCLLYIHFLLRCVFSMHAREWKRETGERMKMQGAEVVNVDVFKYWGQTSKAKDSTQVRWVMRTGSHTGWKWPGWTELNASQGQLRLSSYKVREMRLRWFVYSLFIKK